MVAAELVVSVSYTLQKFIQLPALVVVGFFGVSVAVADSKTRHTSVVSGSSCSNTVSRAKITH